MLERLRQTLSEAGCGLAGRSRRVWCIVATFAPYPQSSSHHSTRRLPPPFPPSVHSHGSLSVSSQSRHFEGCLHPGGGVSPAFAHWVRRA